MTPLKTLDHDKIVTFNEQYTNAVGQVHTLKHLTFIEPEAKDHITIFLFQTNNT